MSDELLKVTDYIKDPEDQLRYRCELQLFVKDVCAAINDLKYRLYELESIFEDNDKSLYQTQCDIVEHQDRSMLCPEKSDTGLMEKGNKI